MKLNRITVELRKRLKLDTLKTGENGCKLVQWVRFEISRISWIIAQEVGAEGETGVGGVDSGLSRVVIVPLSDAASDPLGAISPNPRWSQDSRFMRPWSMRQPKYSIDSWRHLALSLSFIRKHFMNCNMKPLHSPGRNTINWIGNAILHTIILNVRVREGYPAQR